jgi:hypothetical protein
MSKHPTLLHCCSFVLKINYFSFLYFWHSKSVSGSTFICVRIARLNVKSHFELLNRNQTLNNDTTCQQWPQFLDPQGCRCKQVRLNIQSNLSTTTTHGTPKLWSLLSGGRCSEVLLCSKSGKRDATIVVVI